MAKVEAEKKKLLLEIENDQWEEIDKETASENKSDEEKKKQPVKVENPGGR